jgi:hypothetical protein
MSHRFATNGSGERSVGRVMTPGLKTGDTLGCVAHGAAIAARECADAGGQSLFDNEAAGLTWVLDVSFRTDTGVNHPRYSRRYNPSCCECYTVEGRPFAIASHCRRDIVREVSCCPDDGRDAFR